MEFILLMIPVDGTAEIRDVQKWITLGRTTLLTNDNGLAIRANERGIWTSRYGYKLPAPYTGRREVWVPKDLLTYFSMSHSIEMDVWRLMVPTEESRVMVVNEFIIMRPENEQINYELKSANREC